MDIDGAELSLLDIVWNFDDLQNVDTVKRFADVR